MATVNTRATAEKTKEKVSESNRAAAVAPKEYPYIRFSRPTYSLMIQNIHLIWLDGSIGQVMNEDYHNTIANTFTHVDECIYFITDMKDNKVFMIPPGVFDQPMASVKHGMNQVRAIYIFCGNKARYEQWIAQRPKVRGVFIGSTPIYDTPKQAVEEYDQNSISMGFIAPSSRNATGNLDQLDPTSMYTQILKEILLTIDFEQGHMMKFITYYREQLVGSTAESHHVDKLEHEYRTHVLIWRYTYQCFLYSMFNNALRTMEIDLIIKMVFFARDLREQICPLYSQKYAEHSHSASLTDFEQLKKTQGGLLSFCNFLSASTKPPLSLQFARDKIARADNMVDILFVMNIDLSILSTPCANIHDVSYWQEEEEGIIFSMHYPHLRQLGLILTNDNDLQLHILTECIREEIYLEYKGWKQFDQTTDEDVKAHLYGMYAMFKYDQGKFLEAAAFYEQAIQVYHKSHSSNNLNLATSYCGLGLQYDKMGEYSKALSSHEKALKIYQKTLPPNDSRLTFSYNNIGSVYAAMGEYSKALSTHEKALEMNQKTLPINHADLATSYNNIGTVYNNMAEYSKAFPYYEKALEIRRTTLSENHPDLATSYNNIGTAYNNMGEYSKALSYYEKALEIDQTTLPAYHPDLANTFNNIGVVYAEMGEYSKAVSFHEKALEIRQKTLSASHPDLATSYNNMGMVYNNMGDCSKALSYYEKDLEISQKTLPADHLDLAISYSNIGVVYAEMGEYTKALVTHEKALKIRQNILPGNHPHLACSYGHIGMLFLQLGEHSKAVLYCEWTLKIVQHSLPEDHPDVQLYRNNLEYVKESCK